MTLAELERANNRENGEGMQVLTMDTCSQCLKTHSEHPHTHHTVHQQHLVYKCTLLLSDHIADFLILKIRGKDTNIISLSVVRHLPILLQEQATHPRPAVSPQKLGSHVEQSGPATLGRQSHVPSTG